MSRNKGIFDFSNNFEVRARTPLDAKQRVGTLADLIDVSVWKSNTGDEWTYPGMIVSVWNDGANNGIYKLNADDYTNAANWEKIGTGDITKAYVDSSLGARDASINKLFTNPIFSTSFGVGSWTVDTSGTSLCFKYSGAKKMVLDISGNLYLSGDMFFKTIF
jgi:hypothetical protein